jgi:hypothetical protein
MKIFSNIKKEDFAVKIHRGAKLIKFKEIHQILIHIFNFFTDSSSFTDSLFTDSFTTIPSVSLSSPSTPIANLRKI